MAKVEFLRKLPRRRFLAGFLATAAGVATLLLLPRKARGEAKAQKGTVPDTGPILYRRTEEAERYYRTLYYR